MATAQHARQKATVAFACYVAQEEGRGTLIKRSISLVDHRTSVALEQEFWAALMHIAARR